MRHRFGVSGIFISLMFAIAVSALSIHAQTSETVSTVDRSSGETAAAGAKQSTGGNDLYRLRKGDDEPPPGVPQIYSLPPYRLRKGDNEFGFWGGVAFQATTIFGGLHADEASGRKFVIAALRYGRTIAATKNNALQYTLDVVPLAVATGNIVQTTSVTTPTGTVTTFTRESTYGWGLTPLGLQLDFRNSSHIKPFIHVNGGGLLFNKPVPLPDAGKFAFVGEAGTGVRIFTSDRRAVTLGLMFHHISNGNRSGSNRGLNEFVLNAGFSVFK